MTDSELIAELRRETAGEVLDGCGPELLSRVADRMEANAMELRIAEERVAFLRVQVADLCAAIDAAKKKIRKLEREAKR